MKRPSVRARQIARPPGRRPLRSAAGLFLAGVLGASCGPTRYIDVMPPRPAVVHTEAPHDLSLSVYLAGGYTPLHPDVASLSFRVAEVMFHRAGDGWARYPARPNQTAFARRRQPDPPLLLVSTRAAAGVVDSVAVRLTRVEVSFLPGTEGALVYPRDGLIRLAAPLSLDAGRDHALHLVVEPGASLARAPDGRWFLLPFVTTSVH